MNGKAVRTAGVCRKSVLEGVLIPASDSNFVGAMVAFDGGIDGLDNDNEAWVACRVIVSNAGMVCGFDLRDGREKCVRLWMR